MALANSLPSRRVRPNPLYGLRVPTTIAQIDSLPELAMMRSDLVTASVRDIPAMLCLGPLGLDTRWP